MRSDSIRVSPRSNDWYPYKRRRDAKTETQREGGHVKTGADIGVMAATNQGTSTIADHHRKLGGARKDPPLEPPEGAWLCWHLDFGLYCLQNCERLIFVIVSHPVCGTSLGQPQLIHLRRYRAPPKLPRYPRKPWAREIEMQVFEVGCCRWAETIPAVVSSGLNVGRIGSVCYVSILTS